MLTVTDKDIVRMTEDKTMVLFRADWCPFCRRFKPIFDSYERKTTIKLAEAVINEDEDPLWDRYNIKVVPTLVAFRNGKPVARRDGKAGIGLEREDMDSLLKEIS
jgi:thioredoxin 1